MAKWHAKQLLQSAVNIFITCHLLSCGEAVEETNNWKHLTDLSETTSRSTTSSSTLSPPVPRLSLLSAEQEDPRVSVTSFSVSKSLPNLALGFFGSLRDTGSRNESLSRSWLSAQLAGKNDRDTKNTFSQSASTNTNSTALDSFKVWKKPTDIVAKNKTVSNTKNSSVTNYFHNPNKVISRDDLTDDLGTWEAPEWMQKQFPYFLAGYDEEDRPLWMGEIGKFNFRKVVEQGGQTLLDFDRYVQQAAYRVIKSMEARDVSEAVYLIDMDGLEFTQLAHVPTVTYVLRLARLYRDLVVSHLGGGVIVNASFMAETLINILRPILSRALEKVEIIGTSKAKWLPVVLRKYPRQSLPPWYGGYQSFKPLQVYG